jgi:ElaB/YqjD/DUF883 family membrane-anchored ribosome-binding protein
MNEHERDIPNEVSPDQIEVEIQRTRDRMGRNIDELGARLSPDNLKELAKEKISEKAHGIVTGVGDQAQETGDRMLDFITRNPLPVAAVGLGALWLFTLRKGDRSEVSGDRMARFAYTGPERREIGERPGLGRRLVDRADTVRRRVSDTVSDASERAGALKGRVQERAGQFGNAARARTRDAEVGFEQMMNDYPLAAAAGAAIIGLALGTLLPGTDTERQVMGEKRDEIVNRVQQAAGRAKDVAIEAGRDLQETVREEVSERAPEMKDAVKEVGAALKHQVKDSASRIVREAKQEIRARPPAKGGGGEGI